jgi:septation ring formation regulator EzrA
MKNVLQKLKEANKSLHSYYRHINLGYSVEEAFEKAVIKSSKFITVEINGVSYFIKDAMKLVECQVTYSTVMKRIQKGMSPLEAITKPSQLSLLFTS